MAKGDLGILPPDPNNLINQATKSNIDTANAQAKINNPNQFTPWGSSTWTPGTPGPDGSVQWTQNINLSPEQQKLFNTQQGTAQTQATTAATGANQLKGLLAQPITGPSYTGYTAGPNLATTVGNTSPIQTRIGGTGDYGANVQHVEDALFARANPDIERDRTRLETQLANQGITRGSAAYNDAVALNERNVNDRRNSISLEARQEQNRLQGLELNQGNFANQAQAQQFAQMLARAGFSNQAIQQMFENRNTTTAANNDVASQRFGDTLATRNQKLNEQAALMNGQQVGQPQFPNTSQTGVAGVDTAGIQTNRFNQMQNLWGGLLSGAGNLMGAWSDRRLKRDIRRIGTADNGLAIYAYHFEGDPVTHIGFMADEVRQFRPEAVNTDVATGYDKVDYAKAVA